MSYDRLNERDVNVGRALPYSVYDASGNLLLVKGHVISSAQQLNVLMSKGMYRQAESDVEAKAPIEVRENPFVSLQMISERLVGLQGALAIGKPEAVIGIQRLSQVIQRLCEKEPDALLAAVHLLHEERYTTYHALHCSILCEIAGRSLEQPIARRLSFLSAALTANISILELQNELNGQKGALTEQQQYQINTHPTESVRMLKEAGVDDRIWLDTVLHHHERINGGGYPGGLKQTEIVKEAKLLAVADRYAAMVSSRSYRESMMSISALRECLLNSDNEFDERLSLLLIKEMGIYPPGTFVKLVNGETAVITRRSHKGSMQPMASSFISPRGGLFANPLRRDCSCSEYTIKEVCALDEGIKLNLHTLWGYH